MCGARPRVGISVCAQGVVVGSCHGAVNYTGKGEVC